MSSEDQPVGVTPGSSSSPADAVESTSPQEGSHSSISAFAPGAYGTPTGSTEAALPIPTPKDSPIVEETKHEAEAEKAEEAATQQPAAPPAESAPRPAPASLPSSAMLLSAFTTGHVVADRYELGEIIGKGASAIVFRCTDRESGTDYAAKVIQLHSKGTTAEVVDQEVALMRRLKHPNILRVHDVHRESDVMVVILELAAQGSLLDHIRKLDGHPDETTVAQYVHQVLCGVLYLHAQGVVHRDIKAANIMLTSRNDAKVGDFGLATNTTSGTSDEDLVGSVYWMAPEAIQRATGDRSEQSVEASDVWSVGCLTVELLTGKPPFYERRPENALYHISEGGEVSIPPFLTEECEEFIRRCTIRDFASRPSAFDLLQSSAWFRNHGLTLTAGLTKPGQGAEPDDAEVATTTPPRSQSGSVRQSLEHTQEVVVEPNDVVVGSTHDAERVPGLLESPPPQQRQLVTLESLDGDYPAWVEHHLLSGLQEEWLAQDSLAQTINHLTKIPADHSFRVVKCLAHSARQNIGAVTSFFTALGSCNLWAMELEVLGTRENFLRLFEASCLAQPPTVNYYAPVDKEALKFMMSNDATIQPAMASLKALICGVAGGGPGTGDSSLLSGSGQSGIWPPPIQSASSFTRDPSFRGSINLSALPDQIDALWRSEAKDRFIEEGALETVTKHLVDAIMRGFAESNGGMMDVNTGPDPNSWVALAFDVVYGVTQDRHDLIRQMWMSRHSLVVLTEGARLQKRGAIQLLVALTELEPKFVGDITQGTHFLGTAVDPNTEDEMRELLVVCLPQMAAVSDVTRANLEQLDDSVPLLNHILNLTSQATTKRHASGEVGEDRVIVAMVKLAEVDTMAEALSRYPKFLQSLTSRLGNARLLRAEADMVHLVTLATKLFEQCSRPDLFVTSTELCRQLSSIVQDTEPLCEPLVNAAKDLLSALGAQSKLV